MPYYKTKELERQALEAINEHKLFFTEDVIVYVPCCSKTFYSHKLHELQTIKDALTKQKVQTKVSMRSKWYESDNATLQMGLMKLIGSDEERRRLSQTHTDITTDGKSLNTPLMNLDPLKIKESK
jgi:hypothetical protein